jgi:phosphopentomutase
MVAIATHAPLSAGEAIEPARDPDLERAQPTRKRVPIIRFHDEMKMRVLKRKVNNAEVLATVMRVSQ